MASRPHRAWTDEDPDWSDINLVKVCNFTRMQFTLGVDWCLPPDNVTAEYHTNFNTLGLWLRVFNLKEKKLGAGKVTHVPDTNTFQDVCLITGVRALTSQAEVDKMLEDYPHMGWTVAGNSPQKEYAGSLLSNFDQPTHLHVRLMFVSEQLRLSCLSWSNVKVKVTAPVDVVIGLLIYYPLVNKQEQLRLSCLSGVKMTPDNRQLSLSCSTS